MPGDVTLLWALRSACSLACRYCYFGTVEEHRVNGIPDQVGVLSHLSRNDLSREQILEFAHSLAGSPVDRVVLAGGEPLDWPGIWETIATIKEAGCKVIVATNGIPLTRFGTAQKLVALDVDGVSVSLDSVDADSNDRLRPSRSGRTGYADVLAGIRSVLNARESKAFPKVGIYTVVMRAAPDEIGSMAALATELRVDYFVPQPISLDPAHPLFGELSHRREDVSAVADQLADLYREPRSFGLPDASYARRFVAAISSHDGGYVPECFGGAQLFFIQPDGKVWDCPSDRRIAATRGHARSIVGTGAKELFAGRPSHTACNMFGRDCVNMWPLVLDFPTWLGPRESR